MTSSTLIPEILLEDPNILAFNKPAGMIVNNADTSRDVFTLQDFINENYPIEITSDNEDFLKRSGIVHRLDKETSGVILAAKNAPSFENIQNQFKERIVEKTYVALVHGKIVEEGSVNVPIGRLPWNRMRFGVITNGRESFTEFKVLKYYTCDTNKKSETLSLIEVYPKTGRTHQIRVHMQYAGFPIFGDNLYAGRKIYKEDNRLLKRHFLHAKKIAINHPRTGKRMEIAAPLTSELEDLLSKFNQL